jgi:alkylation response protein AidB-like acyl-CoA dehydrogenase
VAAAAEGLVRTGLDTLDATRKQARVELGNTPARLIGTAGAGADLLDHVMDIAAIGLATEQVGGAERVMQMAVDYAKIREQFGRPIGSFQAIKHKCADMLLDVESARAAAYYGLWAVAADSGELPGVASLAKTYCSEAYDRCAAANIEIHGGIGFTWEHPAHLYFKRAKSSELVFGDPAYHREKYVTRAGL